MKHCILVKWNETVIDKTAVENDAKKLFDDALSLPEIEDIHFINNCVDKENRYDFLIIIEIKKEDLPIWNECDVHKKWKALFGGFIESKAIFDFE